MIKILAVALGGAIGSTGRSLNSLAVETAPTSRFPYETLTANLAGCFLIGLCLVAAGFYVSTLVVQAN